MCFSDNWAARIRTETNGNQNPACCQLHHSPSDPDGIRTRKSPLERRRTLPIGIQGHKSMLLMRPFVHAGPTNVPDPQIEVHASKGEYSNQSIDDLRNPQYHVAHSCRNWVFVVVFHNASGRIRTCMFSTWQPLYRRPPSPFGYRRNQKEGNRIERSALGAGRAFKAHCGHPPYPPNLLPTSGDLWP